MRSISRRAFVALAVLVAGELSAPAFVLAHDKDGHKTELESVLLDDADFKRRHRRNADGSADAQREAIDAIEAASYVCVDMFNMNGVEPSEYDILRNYGIDLPEIDKIDYSGGGRDHRSYTHCGWDVSYEDDKANWEERKKVLLETVNKVFNFGIFSTQIARIVGYDERCESFAALVYYVHILGDFLEDDTMGKFEGETNGKKVKFARVFPTDNETDIFWELEEHLGVLLEGQKFTLTYQNLLKDMKSIARKARKLARQKGSIDSSDDFQNVHDCAEELMALLSGKSDGYSQEYSYENRVHRLLKKEQFFSEVFRD